MLFEETYGEFALRLGVAMRQFGIAPDAAEGLVQDVFATFLMHAAAVEQVEVSVGKAEVHEHIGEGSSRLSHPIPIRSARSAEW